MFSNFPKQARIPLAALVALNKINLLLTYYYTSCISPRKCRFPLHVEETYARGLLNNLPTHASGGFTGRFTGIIDRKFDRFSVSLPNKRRESSANPEK
jgi:hypothetical protein